MTKIRRKRIQLAVAALLDEIGARRPPVRLERIAKSRGIKVRRVRMPGSDMSGFVLRKGGEVVIGVNASHPPTRQRFTLAHELGHVMLHSPIEEAWHIDRRFGVKFRDEVSSKGTDPEEREANLFAAELLMPRQFVAADLADEESIDLEDSVFLMRLADRYGVSLQALLFRLANLGYVDL